MAVQSADSKRHLLYHARKAKGLTLRETAELAKVDFGQLGRIERGKATGSITTLRKVAEALGLDEDAAHLRRYDPEAK